jgi:ferrochelatase
LSRPFDAVLIVAFGGPRGLADVRPFLANVLRGRRVAPERVEEVVRHYELFGGVSPVTDLTLRFARGLRRRLRLRGPDLPVHVGMRNWHPFVLDALGAMGRSGVRRAIGVIAAAQRSYSSCQQYKENVFEAQRELRWGGRPGVEVTWIDDWHAHPGFIRANVEHVRKAVRQLPKTARPRARLVFTAHSVPVPMAEACPYVSQLREGAKLVAQQVGIDDWALVYQSRSGRPEDPWLAPDICDYLRDERARGLDAVVLCPIGFVSDHIEVLYDLDHQAADLARELGVAMTRARTASEHPAFLDAIAELVRQTYQRYDGGFPLPIAAPSEEAD